jgi:diguanylate cyclase (GGDEF)-like protein
MNTDKSPFYLVLLLSIHFLIGFVWLNYFVIKAKWDVLDIGIESAYYLLMLVSFIYSRYLKIKGLTFGLGLLTTGLFVDVLDEFTREPELWDTFFQGLLEIGGTLIFSCALFLAHHRLQYQLNDSKSAAKLHLHMAKHDPLTGVPNRVLLIERLEKAIESSLQSQSLIGVLYIDLNDFKVINDTYGHNFGDELLKLFCRRVGNCIRSSDMLARIGGDEFIVVMQSIKKVESIESTVEKIHTSLQETFLINGQSLEIHSAIGVAVYPIDGKDADTLLKKADASMYDRKNSA